MDPNLLFLRRCDQLALLLQSKDAIDLVDMAGKIRALLFDKECLADVVNNCGIQLEFKAGTWPPHMTKEGDPHWDRVEYQCLNDGIDPGTSYSGRYIPLTRNQFGQHVIAYSFGKPITVKDVVKYNANAKGGVHFNRNPKPEYRTVAETESFGIGGYSAASVQLRAIARVTLQGLVPLIRLAQSRVA